MALDAPKLPAPAFDLSLLSKEASRRAVALVQRNTPKPDASWVEIKEGYLILSMRPASDGSTFSLKLVPKAEEGDGGGGGGGGPLARALAESSTGSGSGEFSLDGSFSISEPESGSGSEDSSGSDESSDSGSESDSSSKNCIVVFQGKYIGWVCNERPEAKFEDVVTVPLLSGRTVAVASIPVEFADCCVPGTIRATRVMASEPVLATARVGADRLLQVRIQPSTEIVKVAVRIEGTRKGHAGRWREYSPDQFLANIQFYSIKWM